MSQENRLAKADRIEAELAHFTGDIDRYRHPINRRVIYTPGVRHLAEQAGAYWLVDAIASWIGSHSFNQAIDADPRIGSLHFWRLTVDRSDDSARLTADADVGEAPFIAQEVPYTDFPLDEIAIWAGFSGDHWTLYLPSEH